MAGCGGCSKKALAAVRQSHVPQARVESPDKPLATGMVRLRYIGGRTAPVTYYANGHGYPAANTPKWRTLDVPVPDAEVLLRMDSFMRVQVAVEAAPTPSPAPPPVEPKAEPPAPIPVPIPGPPPKVDADAMQAAVAAMEKQAHTGARKYRSAKK